MDSHWVGAAGGVKRESKEEECEHFRSYPCLLLNPFPYSFQGPIRPWDGKANHHRGCGMSRPLGHGCPHKAEGRATLSSLSVSFCSNSHAVDK